MSGPTKSWEFLYDLADCQLLNDHVLHIVCDFTAGLCNAKHYVELLFEGRLWCMLSVLWCFDALRTTGTPTYDARCCH